MPSAFYDKKKDRWIADFRGYLMSGKKRRRVQVPDGRDPKQYAAECEEYCRIVERMPTSENVYHALKLKAITRDESSAITTGRIEETGRLTIIDAALMHPATQREESNPREYDRHHSDLKVFLNWSGIVYADELTLDITMRFVKHCELSGESASTIRHRILWLKRASRMAATKGIPDQLTGFQLVRETKRKEIEVLTLSQLCEIAKGLSQLQDRRYIRAFTVQAFMGLRPSEVIRLRKQDLKNGILQVGVVSRKNDPSRRDLPIPQTLLPWMECDDCQFVHTMSTRSKGPFQLDAFGKWLKPVVGTQVKNLRKSFATWCEVEGVPQRVYESYLGHTAGNVASVTARHYLAAAKARELKEGSQILNAIIENGMKDPSHESQEGCKPHES